MQTQLCVTAFARILPLTEGFHFDLNTSNALFRLLARGRAPVIKRFDLLLWKQLDRPRVIFLLFIMAKKQHTSNISKDNR